MKRKTNTIIPNVVRGGVAIPLGDNYFYMKGRKHKDGGIDIGKNPRTGLEVESDEIVHTSPKELKVYSSVPFLNGISPAEKLLGGENPNKVFDEQQRFKKVNNINDDGSKKAMGGLSRDKDYGSKKKPYPDVNKSDFAGGNRTYPIPTKADAIDALRLAGLHGRKDVRAKVLNKYPELRQKAKRGGIYTVNIGGVEHLKSTSFTGEDSRRNKCVLGTSKPYTTEDYIGATSNILGNISSYFTNKRMLNRLKSPNQPITRQAAKLKTKININPQLDAIRENVSSNERDIEENTASSKTALARKQRIRNIGQQQTNQLYGTKENTETKLINQDKLNQQEVTNKNIEDYNKYQDTVTTFKNAVNEKKSENAVNLISGINNSMQDLISRREKRNADRQTRLAMVAAHPNVNPRILRDLGIEGITDEDIANWDKAFGRKKNAK